MIKFKIAVVGSYPKSIALGKTISRYRASKISEEKLEKSIEKEEEKFFSIIKNIDPLTTTDGLFRWDDIVDVTFSYVSGAEKGELMRFFDNNFYYRKPVIKKELSSSPEKYQQILDKDKELMKKMELKSKLSATILGPLTYLMLSDNSYYKEDELLHVYAKISNETIKKISNIADIIEIHEPSIFMPGIKSELLKQLPSIYTEMLSGVSNTTLLLTYFNLNSSRLEYFFNLPVTYYGIDIVENKNKLGIVYKYFKDKNIFLGVLNTRNTKLERVSFIRRVMRASTEKGKAKDIIIGNASMMDFIPEIIAKRKLYLLRKVEVKNNG
ncbi:hypothetical protein [Acidianus manzaensis]|uniref:5-methyltetrahydropteroyltriglutamate--homocysteine methyltransferase n=1 Tax=Acidianus manzaensis TaxID=282676 RepID=A0A1W6K003_9CREN|nr:hypothetical protein [Acidianus manzaensis]ARM75815.1 5-methyltetrahydropteroyltriglutamate--homocysteine methyltransferase [Acidianus manzaensis]